MTILVVFYKIYKVIIAPRVLEKSLWRNKHTFPPRAPFFVSLCSICLSIDLSRHR